MKIGILGGTFNPPHLGHKNILCQSIEKMALDLVLVIPNNIPPHKKMPKNSATSTQRVEMCQIMCQDVCKAEVSLVEVLEEGQSYTVKTLEKLRNKYPNDELYLIIGTDSLLNFEKWFCFEQIFSMCKLVVLERNHKNQNIKHAKYLKEKYQVQIYLIDCEILEISSSEIRNLKENAKLEDKILQYIEKEQLYKE